MFCLFWSPFFHYLIICANFNSFQFIKSSFSVDAKTDTDTDIKPWYQSDRHFSTLFCILKKLSLMKEIWGRRQKSKEEKKQRKISNVSISNYKAYYVSLIFCAKHKTYIKMPFLSLISERKLCLLTILMAWFFIASLFTLNSLCYFFSKMLFYVLMWKSTIFPILPGSIKTLFFLNWSQWHRKMKISA